MMKNLGGVVDVLGGCVLPWGEILAAWTERRLIKFNTGKCLVLCLEVFESKALHQYRLEVGKHFSREDLGILGDNTLTMNQPCAFVVMVANSFLCCFRKKPTSRKKKIIFYCFGRSQLTSNQNGV